MSAWSGSAVTAIRQSLPMRAQHLTVAARHATPTIAATHRSAA